MNISVRSRCRMPYNSWLNRAEHCRWMHRLTDDTFVPSAAQAKTVVPKPLSVETVPVRPVSLPDATPLIRSGRTAMTVWPRRHGTVFAAIALTAPVADRYLHYRPCATQAYRIRRIANTRPMTICAHLHCLDRLDTALSKIEHAPPAVSQNTFDAVRQTVDHRLAHVEQFVGAAASGDALTALDQRIHQLETHVAEAMKAAAQPTPQQHRISAKPEPPDRHRDRGRRTARWTNISRDRATSPEPPRRVQLCRPATVPATGIWTRWTRIRPSSGYAAESGAFSAGQERLRLFPISTDPHETNGCLTD